MSAHSPQAKGRVERFFGTAQDRWVKQMQLAGVATQAGANALRARVLQPQFNRRFTVAPRDISDAHRPWDRQVHDLRAILCHQEPRNVRNDSVVRYDNRRLQLAKPAWPGLRGGVVTVEARRDGTLAIRFKETDLRYHKIAPSSRPTPP